MDFQIREMRPEDWTAVAAIYKDGIDTNLATFQNDIPTYNEWDAANLPFCRLVAEREGEVLGWAALSPVSSRCVYAGVAEVSVYTSSSTKRIGVGSALINALLKQAEQNGIWTLQSGIMENNTASIRLNEKCGFRMVGYRERIGKDRFGTWRNTVLMERRCVEDEIRSL